ncbi:hypothetical protein SO802_021369 [Lithocarpus litseifolius]|uniref:Uncharacterized protein n=1 Tax=Lithocarpus litseifolius TaxID=425828 RepID=A0AAW2CF63_9ROSI
MVLALSSNLFASYTRVLIIQRTRTWKRTARFPRRNPRGLFHQSRLDRQDEITEALFRSNEAGLLLSSFFDRASNLDLRSWRRYLASQETRGGNFSVEEDVLLVSTWLNTIVDPVHGNEQKQETFTAKVWQYFCQHNTYGTKRSSSSLKGRRSMINRETSKFCGVMAKIESKNQSGATDKDNVVSMGRSLFRKLIFDDSDENEIMNRHLKSSTSQHKCRRYIRRNHLASNERLYLDYFAESPVYPPNIFRRRFRMSRSLFLHIQSKVEAHETYFIQKRDNAQRLGLSSLQKMTATVKMLAYGVTTDFMDEYVRIGESLQLRV